MAINKDSWTLEDVGRHWDNTEDYDDINEKTYSYARRFVDGFRLSQIKKNSNVLDVCCRTGNGSLYFGERVELKLTGMDVSRKMIKIAQSRLKEKKIKFSTVYFSKLPFPLKNDEFDAVLCFETLEHMPNPEEFVREVSRVLKSNGRLILTTPNVLWEPIHAFTAFTKIHHSEGPHKFLRRGRIIKMLEDNGFKVVNEETTVLFAYGPRFFIKIGEISISHAVQPKVKA